MALLRVRLEGASVAGADAEMIVRRLLSEPHRERVLASAVWCEFFALTEGQIEGFVGLLRSRRFHVRYLDIVGDTDLRHRLLLSPLATFTAEAVS